MVISFQNYPITKQFFMLKRIKDYKFYEINICINILDFIKVLSHFLIIIYKLININIIGTNYLTHKIFIESDKFWNKLSESIKK